MIKIRQIRPPGIYLKDIEKFTGYKQVKQACKKAGITLHKLNGREYCPLSVSEARRVLVVIRSEQGKKLLSAADKSHLDSHKGQAQ